MRLLGAGSHAGGEDAEIGELALPAAGKLLQAVVLDPEPGQQLLRVLLEAVDQTLDTARQQRGAAATVDGEHDRRFGEHVVDVGLEPLGGLVDLLFARFTPPVRVEGQADDDGNQHGVDQATVEKLGAKALACPPKPRSQSRRNGCRTSSGLMARYRS